ncbi:MAG: hypothetical protein ACFFD2_16480 [Promethearchaeota archaeon]
MRCEHCNTLTYKRLSHKTVRCPICKKKLMGEPIKFFTTAHDAVSFIKQEKMKEAPKGGNWFENFK